MEYMFAFVTGLCCSLHSSYLLSLCSESSISATVRSITGTNLLDSHVRWLAIVPQWKPDKVKLSLSIIEHCVMEACRRVEICLLNF